MCLLIGIGKPLGFWLDLCGIVPEALKVLSVVIGMVVSACIQQQYVRCAQRRVVSFANCGSIWNVHALHPSVCAQAWQQEAASFASTGPFGVAQFVLL